SVAEVCAVMCTVKFAPAARVVGPQVSFCDPLAPVIWHPAGTGEVSIVQVTPDPDPAGNGSLTVTPVACPAPVLLTLMVTPIGSPASTDAASAVLRMWISAPSTVKGSQGPVTGPTFIESPLYVAW